MGTSTTSTASTASTSRRSFSGVRAGVLSGPRTPASRMRRGDLITGDPLALAGDRQSAWRVVRAPRGAWVVAEPVTRDVAHETARGPYSWRATGPATAQRVPRGGVFVLPGEDEGGAEEPSS